MSDEKLDRLAEQLLDATLAHHKNAEPRWGLEERILANLRTQPPTPQRMWWKWLPVLAATAIVLAVALTAHVLRRSAPSNQAATVIAAHIEQKQEAGLNDKAPLKPTRSSPHTRNAHSVAAKRTMPAASLAQRMVTASEAIAQRVGAQTPSDLRIEEVRISDFNLKEIVINKNDQDK
jgi:hypothetical protein